MGARQREESIKEEPEEQDEPSDVVMEEKEEEEHSEIPGLNRPVQAGDESWRDYSPQQQDQAHAPRHWQGDC